MRPMRSGIAASLLLALFAWLGHATIRAANPILRPFADYEDTGFVFMSAFDAFGANDLKRAIASHLPPNVTLILYGHSTDAFDRSKVLDDYRRFRAPDRLLYVTFKRAKNMFWSRDAMPIPLLDASGRLALADAKYFGGFEPDAAVAALFGAGLTSHGFRFEGGNLMANHLGDCVIVESRHTRRMADGLFTGQYGCRAVTRLPKRGGIGHIDERARFVNATTIVSDTDEYIEAFSQQGFTTVRLPRPKAGSETYVNVLLVNGTAFVPQFGRPDDAVAVEVYRRLGFKVIGLAAKTLASKGRGLLHCLTMNYPRVPLAAGANWPAPADLP